MPLFPLDAFAEKQRAEEEERERLRALDEAAERQRQKVLNEAAEKEQVKTYIESKQAVETKKQKKEDLDFQRKRDLDNTNLIMDNFFKLPVSQRKGYVESLAGNPDFLKESDGLRNIITKLPAMSEEDQKNLHKYLKGFSKGLATNDKDMQIDNIHKADVIASAWGIELSPEMKTMYGGFGEKNTVIDKRVSEKKERERIQNTRKLITKVLSNLSVFDKGKQTPDEGKERRKLLLKLRDAALSIDDLKLADELLTRESILSGFKKEKEVKKPVVKERERLLTKIGKEGITSLTKNEKQTALILFPSLRGVSLEDVSRELKADVNYKIAVADNDTEEVTRLIGKAIERTKETERQLGEEANRQLGGRTKKKTRKPLSAFGD